jgi:hypothetical protein
MKNQICSLSSTIDLVLDLHLDHPKVVKDSKIRMWECMATSYDVQGIQEQNSSPLKMVIFQSFKAQTLPK